MLQIVKKIKGAADKSDLKTLYVNKASTTTVIRSVLLIAITITERKCVHHIVTISTLLNLNSCNN